MGDYAEMELEREIWGRYPDRLDDDRPRRPKKAQRNLTHQCKSKDCGKWCRGEAGLKMHMRDKHGVNRNKLEVRR